MRPLPYPLFSDFYTSGLAQFPINFLAGIFEAAGIYAYEPGGSCLCQCCYVLLVCHFVLLCGAVAAGVIMKPSIR